VCARGEGGREMTAYVIRRLLWGALLLILVTAVTFVLFRVIPTGNPAVLRAGHDPQKHFIEELERVLGLKKSLPAQFWLYMKEIFLHFNFGYSYYNQESVVSLIRERLPATLSLTVGAATLWVIGGLTVGILSALKRHSFIDRLSMGGALVVLSAPEFWLGLIFLFLFANDIGKFKILPGSGTYVGLTSNPGKWFESLIMPWIVLASGSAAVFARLVRGSLIETMGEDYIRTARAKGLPEKSVVRQGVRSAINPAVTLLALEIGVLMGGAVLVETVFNIPGVGVLSYKAIQTADFSVIQGTVLLASMFIIIANLVADIAYAYLDPRVRYG
jgi:peptide/nickel transport system permease protein